MAQLTPVRRVAAWAVWLALCAWSAGPAAARPRDDRPALEAWSWPTTPQHQAVARILRASRTAKAGSESVAATELARLGPAAQDALLDILVRGRVPETQPGDAPQILSEPQRLLVTGALARAPRVELRLKFGALLAAAPEDVPTRLAVIHLLGAVGRAEDLVALPRLAPRKELQVAALPASAAGTTRAAIAQPAELTRDARAAVRDACAGILRRDPAAWRALARLARDCDAPALRALLDGLGNSRDPRGLEILLRTARAQKGLAAQAVSLVPKLGRSTDPEFDREFAEWMSAELPYARTEQARMLLVGIGTLDDGACAAVLVDALEHEDPQVREGALRALRQLSGLGYGADARVWRLWLDAEARWHETEREVLREQLEAADTASVVAALQAYSGRRTRRAGLAAEVAVVLHDPRPEVRVLACGALQALDSPAAYRPLGAALDDEDERVAGAALAALRALSGCALPDDAAEARRLLQLD